MITPISTRTVTATLTIALTSEDGADITLIEESLRRWLSTNGPAYIQDAILDNAPPEYPMPDYDDSDQPTNEMLNYDAWTGDGWRMDVSIEVQP